MDSLNIIAIISLIGIVIIGYKLVVEIRLLRHSQKESQVSCVEAASEYDAILSSTHILESDRRKNNGEKLGEDVYLNRAETIRTKTKFFKLIEAVG